MAKTAANERYLNHSVLAIGLHKSHCPSYPATAMQDPGEQSSTKKTPRSLRNTPGGDRTGSADPAAEDGGSDPEAEAPVPPLEVTMETNDPANDSEQHKNRGRSRKQQASRDASLVETPRSGTKDESRSPSQQTSERSDQDINSQEAGEVR